MCFTVFLLSARCYLSAPAKTLGSRGFWHSMHWVTLKSGFSSVKKVLQYGQSMYCSPQGPVVFVSPRVRSFCLI